LESVVKLSLRLAVVFACVASARPVLAQSPPGYEDWGPRKGHSYVLGLGYQSPEGAVLSAGVIVGTVPGKQNKCIFGATSDGLLIQGHIGVNGPKVSVGVARYNPGVGFGAKVSVVHLWRTVGDSPSGTTLVGPEVEAALFLARLNVGVLWRTGGPSGSSPRFTWGAGVGF
jgi:hypothetical protein